MGDFVKQLSKYIPETAAPVISQWINDTGCRLKVTRSRKSKLGDYRAPYRGDTHQITVNHDLNPYAFLITTVHEFAHLKTWMAHRHRVKPHGVEWKLNFKLLMDPFLQMDIFPQDIVQAVSMYLTNPAASSCTDINLYRVLKRYDSPDKESVFVEELAENDYFRMENGRVFQKLEKVRKRYKCKELNTQRIYHFHALAEVFVVKD